MPTTLEIVGAALQVSLEQVLEGSLRVGVTAVFGDMGCQFVVFLILSLL